MQVNVIGTADSALIRDRGVRYSEHTSFIEVHTAIGSCKQEFQPFMCIMSQESDND